MLRGARKALLIATALILLTLSITTYLINTYLTHTPLSERLPTLNGYLLTYDGPELTKELWSKLHDYAVSNSSIGKYVEWLKEVINGDLNQVMDSNYIYWFFSDGSRHTFCSMSKVVRVGAIELPYSASIIISAYKCREGLNIVIHATISNETTWRELLAKALMLTFRLEHQG